MDDRNFLNVPEEIKGKIFKKEECVFSSTFRGLYHKGKPEKEDFLPTFVDERQKAIQEKRKQLGGMASVVVSNSKSNVGDYAVSLFTTSEALKEKIWRTEVSKNDHPAIACGPIDPNKGYATQDKECHISYFLYDYDSNNPYTDFTTIEEYDGE